MQLAYRLRFEAAEVLLRCERFSRQHVGFHGGALRRILPNHRDSENPQHGISGHQRWAMRPAQQPGQPAGTTCLGLPNHSFGSELRSQILPDVCGRLLGEILVQFKRGRAYRFEIRGHCPAGVAILQMCSGCGRELGALGLLKHGFEFTAQHSEPSSYPQLLLLLCLLPGLRMKLTACFNLRRRPLRSSPLAAHRAHDPVRLRAAIRGAASWPYAVETSNCRWNTP